MPKDAVTKPVKIRLVELRGESAVVEYAGGMQRAIIPAAEIVDGAVSAETLVEGIPYGLPWEKLIKLSATPEQLATELRANGIWTLADIENNPSAVYGAIQKVYGVELSTLLLAAQQEVKHGKR